MARKESGTVRPTKRKHVFFAAAVLLLVCVLAAGAVSAVEVSTLTELQNAINAANQGSGDATIVVAGDIQIGANDAIPAITTNIILTTTAGENHRIYRTAENTSYQSGMFTVQNSGNLTIRGNKSGTLTLDGNQTALTKNNQSLVWVAQGGNFTLKSGVVLSNNEATNNGGAVYVNGGTFTMSGGEISQNKAMFDKLNEDLTGSGGGVYIENGTFRMSYSANIGNNTAYYGGGVFMKGSSSRFEMSGNTEISQNLAKNMSGDMPGGTSLHAGRGGGVHIDNGTFVMSGSATISWNNAEDNGGGVYVHYQGNFTMNNGNINDNTARGNGGGVLIADFSTFTMTSGEISNNTVTMGNGGGVYLLSSSKFTMTGGEISNNTAGSGNGGGVDVRIYCVFTMSGGTITGNAAEGAESSTLPQGVRGNGGGVGVNAGGTFTLSGGTITDNEADINGTGVYVGGVFNIQKSGTVNGVYLPDGKNITVTGTLNDDTAVTGIIPANPAQDLLVVDLDKVLDGNYLSRFELDDSVKNFALKYQQAAPVGLYLTPTHTVTFEENGGTPVPDQTVNHGDTVDEPDDPTKDGHTFVGWHNDTSLTTLWNFDTDKVTNDMTLYAKWTKVPPSGGGSSDGNMDNAYRVLFNDGAATLYVVTDLSAGDKLTKPEDPVKDGYTFAGWHKDSACTQAWDFNDGITGSMTLYAKWTPQETVTPTATATVTPTVTATTTQTAEPTGNASPAPTSQPDNNGNSGDTTNGETTATSGISLPYLIGGILILLLAILLLLFLLLRHTVTFLIPTGGELEEYRIKVWHGRYINTEDLPDLIRTAAWYRDPARQERWDFDQDRVKKSIELYLG